MGFLENIGTPEIIVLAVVLLILFGPKKLPEFAKGLADAAREIVKAFKGEGSSEKQISGQSRKNETIES
jgi:sec-independent protein translocase protein TatA